MRTSSLGRREQEVQEQRKKGRAGASTARSSVKHCKQSKSCKSNGEEREQEHEHRAEQQRKARAYITASWKDLTIASGRSHARYARALGPLRDGSISFHCFVFYKNVGVCLDEFVVFFTVPSRIMLQNVQKTLIFAVFQSSGKRKR